MGFWTIMLRTRSRWYFLVSAEYAGMLRMPGI
jgi:hypothetical protein